MADLNRFIHDLSFADLPDAVVHDAIRCLVDLIGVAAAGTGTALSAAIRNHAVEHFAAGPTHRARLFFDGRTVSPTGAAMANGMTIDSVDAHDGHPACKGHVGLGILSAILAMPDSAGLDGKEFITRIVIGYELGSRLGQALHATAQDYHTSGAWCALADAALGARALGLDAEQTRHALGIAEFHGPRSQMMRVIDHPTMLKDGSGWGAMCGVSAAFLAADGFTGAPALLMESDDVSPFWADLGTRWCITEQYFKPDPVCRWAQPPVQAVRNLRAAHGFTVNQIDHIEVASFHEAIRLATDAPENTEQAQYSLPFPVALAAVRGQILPADIRGEALEQPDVLRLATGMKMSERETYNAVFPERRIADVTLVMRDGTRLESGPTEAHGSAENRMSDTEVWSKFQMYASPLCGEQRASDLLNLMQDIAAQEDLGKFSDLVFAAA